VSPFLPGDYQDSATPAGVFVYTIENTGGKPASVGLMFTFQNGIGELAPGSEETSDRAGGHVNRSFRLDDGGGEVIGVALHHAHRHRLPKSIRETLGREDDLEDPLTFAIAAQARPGVEVTHRSRFVSTSSAMDVWGDFREDGKLENHDDERPSTHGMAIGAALAATVEVPPGESREVAFALAWDMPLARFTDGTGWYRRYTKFYGRGGDAAPAIARDALVKYPKWEEAIAAWQGPILDQTGLPDWYKAALFNELYFLADGGTLWTDGAPALPEPGEDGEPLERPSAILDAPDPDGLGHFAYLEGHEYRMVNTYDVHFYASFALATLFPALELSLQRDFARAVLMEDDEPRRIVYSGKTAPRKVLGAVPHDLGGPNEDPWRKLNVYDWQDSSAWKDLNPMFALQVYRDFVLTGDKKFAASAWEAVKAAMGYVAQLDLDEDGLIENDRTPDTTFDSWEMDGPSAYCGGLWLAALAATAALADALGHPADAAHYREMLGKGQAAYEEALWNEEYYDFDASSGYRANTIMAAQMVGPWYARACGLDPVVPPEHAQSALKKVYRFNVKQFEDGEIGAVNGMLPDGRVDTSALQSQEVWTGITYALAAAMLHEGLFDEAWATAKGVYNGTYREFGYWFATPEAWNVVGDYRSLAYMRPLAIWAMQWAWERGK
jgi:non-lysosomal glucosylceramidase